MPDSSVDDHELAHKLAGEVGKQLLSLRQDWQIRSLARGMSLASQGDLAAHDALLEMLGETRDGDAVLSEEGVDDLSRLGADRLWVVDPLDGSSDYAYGSSEWAVHVGLTIDGVAVAGAVALPALELTFATGSALKLLPEAGNPPKIVTARSRIHIEGMVLASELDVEVFACGSAGVKAMLVVHGAADAYIHASGIYEWDVCAPAVVAESAGLHVSNAFGEPLRFNQRRPVVDGFLVCRKELAEPILAVLQDSVLGARRR